MSTRHSSYHEVTKCDDTELPVVREVHGRSNAIRDQYDCDMKVAR